MTNGVREQLEIIAAERDEARDMVKALVEALNQDKSYLPGEAMHVWRKAKACAARWR